MTENKVNHSTVVEEKLKCETLDQLHAVAKRTLEALKASARACSKGAVAIYARAGAARTLESGHRQRVPQSASVPAAAPVCDGRF